MFRTALGLIPLPDRTVRVLVSPEGFGAPPPPFSSLLLELKEARKGRGIIQEIEVDGDERSPARIHAVVASPDKKGGSPVIAFLHGKGGSAAEWIRDAKVALEHGFSVVIPNLRGHAPSTGEKVTYGVLETEDLRRVLESARERLGFNESRLGIDACSMGTLIALQFAALHPVTALWLQAPFGHLQEMASHYLSRATGVPSCLLTLPAMIAVGRIEAETGLTLESIDPVAAARLVTCPAMIVHGEEDENVPLSFAFPILDALAGPKELWRVPRCGHCHQTTEPRNLASHEYVTRWIAFFEEHVMGIPVKSQRRKAS